MLECNSDHFSFIRATSNTLPTAVNLQQWHIQLHYPTTAHVLGCCPSALTQGCFTYHNQVYCLASELFKFLAGQCIVSIYAGLPRMWASDSPRQQSLFSPLHHIAMTLFFTMREIIVSPYWGLHAPWTQFTALNLPRIVSEGRRIISNFSQNLIAWEFPVSMTQCN